MPGPSLLNSVGGSPQKPVRFASIYTNRWISGLYTNRSLLRGPLDSLYTDFYHMGTTDVLCDGLNSEVSARSTMIRRPGNPAYSSANTSGAIDSFYGFHLSDGTIKVIADSTVDVEVITPSSITSIFTKSSGAGQGYFQGVDKTMYIADGVDLVKYIPGQINPITGQPIWNMGGVAPTVAPTVVSTQTGSAGVVWQANTVFTTMGLLLDQNGNIQQLISVNANGSNPSSQFGTSGNGSPAWNQTIFGTTTETSGTPIVWKNLGAINQWQASFSYGDAGVAGSAAPVAIFDPVTQSVYLNFNHNGATSQSGTVKPSFNGVAGSSYWDNQCHWFFFGKYSDLQFWKPSTGYTNWYAAGGNHTPSNAAIEPVGMPPPTNQSVFLQVPTNTGTSGSAYPPAFGNAVGTTTQDNQLLWLNLGSATWSPVSSYTAWTGSPNSTFSVINDPNGNLQVCIVSGVSGSTQPTAAWQAAHAYSNGNTISDTNNNLQTITTPGTSGVSKTLTNSILTSKVATYTTSTNHGYSAGQLVTVTSSSHNTVFNVKDAIILSTPALNTFTIAISADDITTAADTGTSVAGPTWNTTLAGTTTDGTATWTNGGQRKGWGTTYGATTQDGTTVTWVNVGPSMAWAASTIWYLPASSFQPPSTSSSFGGASVIGNAFVQFVTSSGKSGGGSAPTFSTNVGNFVLDNGIVWRSVSAFTAVGFALTTGTGWCYSYKARKLSDTYVLNPPPLQIPGTNSPNPVGPLGPPTGSADGTVTTASPVTQVVGANAGAQFTISGPGSTDPQFDTVEIYRAADGFGASGPYLLLTDIPMPVAVGGQAGTWSIIDFMPDSATSTLPGLNPLITAPIAHQNDPPPGQFGSLFFQASSVTTPTVPAAGTALIGLTYHQGRLWGHIGNTVFVSGGPDTIPGNGFTAWPPGQTFPFQSNVIKLLATTAGLLVFTTTDLGFIGGGPAIADYYSQLIIPGLGLLSPNSVAVLGGIPYLFSADRQLLSIEMTNGVIRVGHPIGDLLAQFDPSQTYLTYHSYGDLDHALFLSDGSSQWFRCDVSPAPDGRYTGPVWSPKATVSGGFKAIASIETSPGTKQLLVGPPGVGKILARDSTFTTFTDGTSAYSSFFVMGNVTMAHPGQMVQLNFLDLDFKQLGSLPSVSVLFDEIAPTSQVPFETISNSFITDPPKLYGQTGIPQTMWMNRYYFGQTEPGNAQSEPIPAWCKSMQIKVDFGNTDTVQNELMAFTIHAALWQEK